ncbi:MAG: HlyD family type I secretion periplasmic adaptor subunit [Magnetococcales bacterium]|nr:HlyD family type I secretion periplasmic adaptor subunit [Magnetococcales bacterium]
MSEFKPNHRADTLSNSSENRQEQKPKKSGLAITMGQKKPAKTEAAPSQSNPEKQASDGTGKDKPTRSAVQPETARNRVPARSSAPKQLSDQAGKGKAQATKPTIGSQASKQSAGQSTDKTANLANKAAAVNNGTGPADDAASPAKKGGPALSGQAPVAQATAPVTTAAPDSEVDQSLEDKKAEAIRSITSDEDPESLLSLLVPKPEEVPKLKQGTKLDRFLSQSVVLEESGLSTLVRSSILLVTVLVTVFLLWAANSSIDEMASTTGTIIPNSPAQIIQHLEGGIIADIMVEEGQIIKKGGLLIRLDPEAARAELNQMRARQASLMAQKERLTALIEQRNPDFSDIPDEYDSIVQGQQDLLVAQRSAYNSQIELYETRIDRIKSRLENLFDQQRSLEKQLAYSQQEMDVRQKGYDKGLMSRLMVISANRDEVRVESELVRIKGDVSTSQKDLNESLSEMDGLIDSTAEANFRELGTVTAELSQISQGLSRLKDRVSRLEIRSPAWGIVKALQVKTVGGVIAPGSVIMEIIPLDETRRVEIKISTRDIGHVKLAQGVTVKVGTYDFARYGGISGVLESISPTTFDDPAGGEAYYKGIVRLEKSHVGGDPGQNQVLPGMTVQADIHTGAKTLMEYMLKPIYSSVNKSFRER